MSFLNFIGRMLLFNHVWKRLFGSRKASRGVSNSCSIKVRGIVAEQEREADIWRGYNEEILSDVDDLEARLDYCEEESYATADDDYYSGAGWQTNEDYFYHDDYSVHDHYDFDHDSHFDDHDW